jgi:pSer/pThr/pTyr-binding forkhead associated (FHA) protein
MQLALTAIEGKPEVAAVVFGPGEYLFGRSQECDVRIGIDNRHAVSRRHCIVTVNEDGASVCDQRSRNGTWINSKRITNKQPLYHGYRLRIGSFVFLARTDSNDARERVRPDPCDTAEILLRAVRPFPDETVDAPIDRTLG